MSLPGVSGGRVLALEEWDPDGLGPQPAQVVAAGEWQVVGGQVQPSVARWDGSSWIGMGSELGVGEVRDLDVLSTGELVAVGSFQGGAAKWNGGGWDLLAGGHGINFPTSVAVLPGDQIVVASQNEVLIWNGSEWSVLETTPYAGVYWASAVAARQGAVVCVGQFYRSTPPQTTEPGVAIWNGASWDTIGRCIHGDSVTAVTVLPDGDVVVGGFFSSMDGTPVQNVARWDGSDWHAVGALASIPPVARVTSIVHIGDGHLVVGGDFQESAGAAGNYLAQWDGTSWRPLGPGTSGIVRCVAAVAPGDVLVGGEFDFAGSQVVGRLARWGIPSAPQIFSPPRASVIQCGGIATFSIATGGSDPVTYRWRRGGRDLSDGPSGHGSLISGSAGPMLAIVNAGTADSGGYDCVVSSSCGIGASSVAALTVVDCCRADFNGNGAASVQDIFDFLATYFAGCP